tara:strand:+ start:2014 stop:2862 length:849 start_codon:yes stop_codon:yes gene_type:complete
MEKKIGKNELIQLLDLFKKAKQESSIESYIFIKNLLNTIEFNFPVVFYKKGSRFVRSRIHKKENEYFRKVSDISYRTDVEDIRDFGRANEPAQSVFYCSNNDWISYVETSEIVSKNKEKAFEEFTTGLWIATEDIMVVYVLTNDEIRGINTEIDEISKDFENYLKEQSDENAEILKNLLHFLSLEFSQKAENNPNHYKITSAFTNYVFDSLEQADGILYPSTLYPEKGLNFALKNSAVDKKLKFHSAIRRKTELKYENKYVETDLIESKICIDNENIKWKIL